MTSSVWTASHATDHWDFRYTAQKTVQEEYKTCIAFETIDGRQVCKTTHTERRDHVIPVRETMRLTKIGDVPPQRPGAP